MCLLFWKQDPDCICNHCKEPLRAEGIIDASILEQGNVYAKVNVKIKCLCCGEITQRVLSIKLSSVETRDVKYAVAAYLSSHHAP